MTIPMGHTVYKLGSPPCTGIGMQWGKEDLDASLEDVATLLFDDAGTEESASIFATVFETEFEQEKLNRTLQSRTETRDWRVGEAIAESYLVYQRSCYFPWPSRRDERKAGSSLPGADLVGLVADDNGDRLAFGEAKTSQQTKYPPAVMYGQKGLKRQLKDLRDREYIRDTLFKYMVYRSKNAPWLSRFKTAGTRYLHNKSDVQIFGMMIRDVPPKVEDLRACVQGLAQYCPVGTTIEVLALYLPNGSISGIGRVVTARRSGGGAQD